MVDRMTDDQLMHGHKGVGHINTSHVSHPRGPRVPQTWLAEGLIMVLEATENFAFYGSSESGLNLGQQ